MMQQNDYVAMQSAHEADDERTKAANKATDDSASAASKLKDTATRQMNMTSNQFAPINYRKLDEFTAQKLIAEREAASRIAATELHDAME